MKQTIKKLKKIFYNIIIKIKIKNKTKKLEIKNDKKKLEDTFKKKKISCVLNKKRNYKNIIDLSIIVPMYNAEIYVFKLVNILLNQKTNYDYEIILVNDGSKDNTLELIRKYDKENKNIIIINKENGGLSSARNAGMEIAKGKYLTFIDADDYISLDYVEKMLKLAYQHNADIVKCGVADFYNNKIIAKHINKNIVIDGKMNRRILDYSGYSWNKIYKSSILDNMCYPDGYWYEDMITRSLIYRKCNKFVNTSDILYFRVFHEDQLTKTQSKKSNRCLEHLYLIETIIDDNKKLKLGTGLDFYLCILSECSSIMVHRMKLLDDDIKQQVFLRVYEIISKLYKEEYRKQMNKEYKLKTDIILKKRYDLWLLERYF